MFDILLRRRRSADDAAAVGADGRSVSCFLRSGHDRTHRRFRQGVLRLDQNGVSWANGTRGRGSVINFKLPVDVRRVRAAGGRGEWNIKKGLFQVVEADTAEGLIELAVPEASVQIVRRRLAEDH